MMFYVMGYALFAFTVFLIFELKEKPLIALFLKGLASFGFLMIFGFSVFERWQLWNSSSHMMPYLVSMPMAVICILFGLIFGLLGDIFLALRPLLPIDKDKRIIVGGIIYFAIGHMFYLTALLLIGPISYLPLIIGLVMLVVVFLGSKILKFEMGIAKYPTLAYTFLIFMMVGQALVCALDQGFSTFSSLILAGAILFSISDLLLAPIYYQGNKSKVMIGMNLATYYAAQFFIAFAIYVF